MKVRLLKRIRKEYTIKFEPLSNGMFRTFRHRDKDLEYWFRVHDFVMAISLRYLGETGHHNRIMRRMHEKQERKRIRRFETEIKK